MIGRYHKIRFFDRQKATKRLKKAKKLLAACENDGEELSLLQTKEHKAEVDLNYALYYPLDQPYTPLFPTRKKPETEQTTDHAAEEVSQEAGEIAAQGDGKMWVLVEMCMAEGRLDALRNGKIGMDEAGPSKSPATSIPPLHKKQRDRPGSVAATSRSTTTADVHGTRRERRAAKALQKEEDEDSEGGFFE